MLRFVQLSDPHLELSDGARHGVNVNRRFSAAVAQICRMSPAPAFCVITGDLVAEETPAHYARLKALCAPLPGPVHYCLGNHDDRALFRASIGLDSGIGPASGRHRYVFDHEVGERQIRFVVLDSHVPGEVFGTLGAGQLTWLQDQLVAEAAQHIIFVHHPPLPASGGWMDEMLLTDGEDLLTLLARSPAAIGRVLFGHVHQPITLSVRGLTLTSAPSTGYQFTDEEVTPMIYAGTGGYQVVCLDGSSVVTAVVPIEEDA